MKNTVIRNVKFLLDYLKFVKFLNRQELDLEHVSQTKIPTYIVVTPWGGTAVPWYSIVLAILLNKKGETVGILFDDMLFGYDGFFHVTQIKLIKKALQKANIPFKTLSKYQSRESMDTALIVNLARLNSLHYTKGETDYEQRETYEDHISKQLKESYGKYTYFFKKEAIDKIIVPGGIWGNSGIVSALSKENNVQLMTYDSGVGLMLFSIHGVAAQLKDVPYTFSAINNIQYDKDYAIQQGREQLKKRREGKDMYDHFDEKSEIMNIKNEYYLMLLNSVWDSAALGLHTVYDSMIDWIMDSIEWVLVNTQHAIVIRQHPAERNNRLNNTDSYEEKLRQKYGHNDRIVFIHAKEDVNTYDLMESAKCILGFSSTSIVESVILEKPAIIVSNTYYSELGIVYKANNKEAYYNYLKKSDNNELKVTKEMQEGACICNYISQSCNWIKTGFTPQNDDFYRWSSRNNIEDFFDNNLILDAVLTNTPTSLLTHKKNIA